MIESLSVEMLELDDYPDDAAINRWWEAKHDTSLLAVCAERALWTEEVAGLPSDVRAELPDELHWAWAVYPWSATAVLVPDEATTYAVLTARNYPIISRGEQRLLKHAHVVLAGLSTGRSVAQQLARIGVGSLHLVDADHLAPSNTNRLVGTRLSDLGVPKAISTARELLEYNPYLRVTTAVEFLDEASLHSHLAGTPAAAVVEMIDSFPAKVGIRRAARAFGVPVVMPTDMDWDPMVDVDYPTAEMFGGRLDDDDLHLIETPTSSFADKTRVAMKAMGLDSWAPRSFLSGELARAELVGFWSQTAPSATVGGAMAARAVFDIVRGQRIPVSRAVLGIRDAFGTSDPVDESETLYQQLQEVKSQNAPGE